MTAPEAVVPPVPLRRVLVVEDDAVVLGLLTKIIGEAGYDVVGAPTLADPASPTLSVHAYSPPLTAMSYYEVTERAALRRTRTALTDGPEGQ